MLEFETTHHSIVTSVDQTPNNNLIKKKKKRDRI